MPPRKKGGSKSSADDDDYKKKRERNNKAVKLCREKSIQTARNIKQQTDELRNRNAELKGKIEEKERNITSLLELLSGSGSEQLVEIRRIMGPLKNTMNIDPELYKQIFGTG